ncbi:hypothetical protein PPL_03200 [Heterostelium album PN500]|uniref:Uncharacterized protein n=1 Tax=Heterostelium pallidum (strain ATCC 26659 / Pp 5 / PN500) TaxID=670386 RepID=D3B479_HETP5|nr:hypothetical protein PPL_03200 [Heterostelium album PN500]EFA84127.1 hypothetical protein PPL_03200 [Heterostelium album PN500]|eukprot:XP_020436244.1 hypothetical protein PPL_03200 [Heterostelium album PN500]
MVEIIPMESSSDANDLIAQIKNKEKLKLNGESLANGDSTNNCNGNSHIEIDSDVIDNNKNNSNNNIINNNETPTVSSPKESNSNENNEVQNNINGHSISNNNNNNIVVNINSTHNNNSSSNSNITEVQFNYSFHVGPKIKADKSAAKRHRAEHGKTQLSLPQSMTMSPGKKKSRWNQQSSVPVIKQTHQTKQSALSSRRADDTPLHTGDIGGSDFFCQLFSGNLSCTKILKDSYRMCSSSSSLLSSSTMGNLLDDEHHPLDLLAGSNSNNNNNSINNSNVGGFSYLDQHEADELILLRSSGTSLITEEDESSSDEEKSNQAHSNIMSRRSNTGGVGGGGSSRSRSHSSLVTNSPQTSRFQPLLSPPLTPLSTPSYSQVGGATVTINGINLSQVHLPGYIWKKVSEMFNSINWTTEEITMLEELIYIYGNDWPEISRLLCGSKSPLQIYRMFNKQHTEATDEEFEDDWRKICFVCFLSNSFKSRGKIKKNTSPLITCQSCERVFHTECLDTPLTQLPKGDWFCSNDCIQTSHIKCEVCSGKDREDAFVLCDVCGNGYHIHCLSPPLSEVPDDKWDCHICVEAGENNHNHNHNHATHSLSPFINKQQHNHGLDLMLLDDVQKLERSTTETTSTPTTTTTTANNNNLLNESDMTSTTTTTTTSTTTTTTTSSPLMFSPASPINISSSNSIPQSPLITHSSPTMMKKSQTILQSPSLSSSASANGLLAYNHQPIVIPHLEDCPNRMKSTDESDSSNIQIQPDSSAQEQYTSAVARVLAKEGQRHASSAIPKPFHILKKLSQVCLGCLSQVGIFEDSPQLSNIHEIYDYEELLPSSMFTELDTESEGSISHQLDIILATVPLAVANMIAEPVLLDSPHLQPTGTPRRKSTNFINSLLLQSQQSLPSASSIFSSPANHSDASSTTPYVSSSTKKRKRLPRSKSGKSPKADEEQGGESNDSSPIPLHFGSTPPLSVNSPDSSITICIPNNTSTPVSPSQPPIENDKISLECSTPLDTPPIPDNNNNNNNDNDNEKDLLPTLIPDKTESTDNNDDDNNNNDDSESTTTTTTTTATTTSTSNTEVTELTKATTTTDVLKSSESSMIASSQSISLISTQSAINILNFMNNNNNDNNNNNNNNDNSSQNVNSPPSLTTSGVLGSEILMKIANGDNEDKSMFDINTGEEQVKIEKDVADDDDPIQTPKRGRKKRSKTETDSTQKKRRSMITDTIGIARGRRSRLSEETAAVARWWIFSGNPKVKTELNNMKVGDTLEWVVRQHADNIRKDDFVYIWVCGKYAGISATGITLQDPQKVDVPTTPPTNTIDNNNNNNNNSVTSPPLYHSTKPNQHHVIQVKIVNVFANVIPKRTMFEHSLLTNMTIIRAPLATNFWLTDEESKALSDLVEGVNNGTIVLPPIETTIPIPRKTKKSRKATELQLCENNLDDNNSIATTTTTTTTTTSNNPFNSFPDTSNDHHHQQIAPIPTTPSSFKKSKHTHQSPSLPQPLPPTQKCTICDDNHLPMIFCDSCGDFYHSKCLAEPIDKSSYAYWICFKCCMSQEDILNCKLVIGWLELRSKCKSILVHKCETFCHSHKKRNKKKVLSKMSQFTYQINALRVQLAKLVNQRYSAWYHSLLNEELN